MLNLIREKQQSFIIKAVFAVIVLSFIGTMYAVWGKGGDGSRRSTSYAAKVNGAKISLEEFQNAYQRIRSIYQQIYGQSMPADAEKSLGLKKAALDNLINSRLILQEADRMGIKVSKEDVANAIAGMPAFQKDGVFSFDLYQQLLKNHRTTPGEFEEQQQQELALRKTIQTVKNRVVVGDGEALEFFRKQNDKVALEYAGFGPSDVIAEIRPTEKELNEYLQKNQNEFKTDEKTAISYIVLNPAIFSHGLTLTEDESQTFYQRNIDRWQGKGGTLPYSEVREQVRAEALRQKASKKAFELAADTLYKNIKASNLNHIAGQLHLKAQDTPLFSAKAPPQALAGETAVIKKAFELKQGELGGPIETSRGIYILRARQRIPSSVPPLAEIRSAVEQKVKEAQAVNLARKKAEEALKLLAAKKAVKTQSTVSFAYSAKGDVPSIGNSPELMEAAFKLTTAAPAAKFPYRVGNRWYAVSLKTRTEAPRAEFEKTKAEFKQRMLPGKQEEALASWLKDLRSKAKIEINPALIAER